MMGQRQQEQVQRGCAVGTVVLLAWMCRVLPLEGLPRRRAGGPGQLGAERSL